MHEWLYVHNIITIMIVLDEWKALIDHYASSISLYNVMNYFIIAIMIYSLYYVQQQLHQAMYAYGLPILALANCLSQQLIS